MTAEVLVWLFCAFIGYIMGSATTFVVLRVRHERELAMARYEARKKALMDPEGEAQQAFMELLPIVQQNLRDAESKQ